MAMREELLGIENALAGGRGDEYRTHLAEDAVVIIPGQALSKDDTVAAMDQSPGWDEFSINEPRVLEVGDDGAVLTYRFAGRRGDDETYEALMSSAYSKGNGAWKLVLHQQTPLEGA
jgi:hypothetical protein